MSVPCIDFRIFTQASGAERRRGAEELGRAACGTGFFYLEHTSVEPDQVGDMLAASREFFALPEERKLRRSWDGSMPVMGYVQREREALDESRPADLKECFNVPPPLDALDAARVGRVWPDADDALRRVAEPFGAACFALGQQILTALAVALDLPEGHFASGHSPGDQTLRLLHYYPASASLDPRPMGAGGHSDHGTLTLLFQDHAGGLEFQDRDGVWKPLPPVEGAVLVNAGDLLTRWTGGAVHSASHRVQSGPRDRFSLAYFFIPRESVRLDCPPTARLAGTPEGAPPMTAIEFLLLRSLRRSERFYRHHGARLPQGVPARGVAAMRRVVAERLAIDDAELDRRLAAFGHVDLRDFGGA